ncbi:LCP family protein [Thermoanaerobacter thermohydrosulfuricus]|jgi:LCP family protein required for cell wall assembly|uniref:Cell envelope-related function transcriptional attenuator common domain protein n=1 Tax=Thermoanaerobacter thermohydrosulfuricus WC1 TaxID=1198630 RepID=M8CUC2_THETY|nr:MULTISPECIES: LCP family protein [Thermoanaerobacter]EMT37968.1 cell envelope-related function transcriptional attenuator common domain protein [Thermoanaerobacter thermohydrosulfuricus WC1]UZQ83867.1 LCP family protein [Thermoanaerobacter sp. RKWS2]
MKKFIKIVSMLLLLSLLSVGVGGYIYLKSLNPLDVSLMNKNSENKNSEAIQKINILVLGVDETSPTDPRRSDTMILLSYNPKTNKAYILSIPRDTMIKLDKYGTQKINAAYPIGGPQLAMDMVSQLIGEPVDYYVKIGYEGFKQLVDDLGGVEMNVPMDMNYDDNAGNLHIHLKKGVQLLDGEKALQLVRFRHGYAEQDLERVKVQREFLLAMFQKAKDPSTLLKIHRILKTINQYVETNIPPTTMLKYADYLLKLDKDNIKTATVPGTPQYIDGVAYYITDPQKVLQFMDNLNDERDDTAIAANKKDIKIEVLNGGGIPGAATKTADLLKQQGYDVVKIGNVIGTTYNTTQIINRTDDKKIVEDLKKILKNAIVVEDTNGDSNVDITIILGKNI